MFKCFLFWKYEWDNANNNLKIVLSQTTFDDPYASLTQLPLLQEPKKLYKYIRLQQKVKPTVGPLISNGQLSQTDQEAAEILQRFFKSVYMCEE